MNHDLNNRAMLLLLDGCRLISMGILQQQHPDIDEFLSDDNTHTKIRQLRDSGRISDEHFHLMFPPTDLSQWDAIGMSTFLKHCTDLKEPQRQIMDELHKLRNKTMEVYEQQEMPNEECSSEWETIVKCLEKGKTLLNDHFDGEINKVINTIKQRHVTLEDMDRVKSWNAFESKYTDTGYEDEIEGRSLIHDAAYHGKLLTLKYMSQEFPNRLLDRDKDGNQVVHFAAEGGHIECLRFIFESFPGLKNKKNVEGQDALYRAASGGNVDCLIYLIKQGMNADTRSKYGHTILHAAAFGANLKMVQHICKTFSIANETAEKGMNAAFSAVRGKSIDCLKHIISQGVNTDTRSSDGNTLLHTAAYVGSAPIVHFLCREFPDLIKEINKKGQDALHSAALGGSVDCLEYLISQGLTTDTRSRKGDTLLHAAVYGGSVPMVEYVWKKIPELRKERNKAGKDASFSAVYGESIACMEYLISQGMNIYTRSNYGRTLLEEATHEGIVSMVQYLCETFADRDLITRTKYGDTLLHVAAFAGSVSIVQYICEQFPEMKYEVNTKGEDSLHSAARGGSLACLIYLIDQKLTTSSRSKYEETILHHAAFHGHDEIVRYISEQYSQLLGYKQNYGRTAIYSAVIGGHLDILKYLLILIDPALTDTNGHTILHVAASNGKTDIVRYLCTAYRFLNYMTGFERETAIDLAQRNGHYDCIKVIQEQL